MFCYHKIKNPVRRLFSGVTCPVCNTYHHTRERLFDHLKPEKHGPNACLMLLNQRGPILTQKQSNNLDAEDKPYHLALFKKGRRRNYVEFPSFPAHGPIVPPDFFLITLIMLILFWKMRIRNCQQTRDQFSFLIDFLGSRGNGEIVI